MILIARLNFHFNSCNPNNSASDVDGSIPGTASRTDTPSHSIIILAHARESYSSASGKRTLDVGCKRPIIHVQVDIFRKSYYVHVPRFSPRNPGGEKIGFYGSEENKISGFQPKVSQNSAISTLWPYFAYRIEQIGLWCSNIGQKYGYQVLVTENEWDVFIFWPKKDEWYKKSIDTTVKFLRSPRSNWDLSKNNGQVKSSSGATHSRSERSDPNFFLPPSLRGLWRGLSEMG